jgi:ADP-heptose:LPS heptosyltransferase
LNANRNNLHTLERQKDQLSFSKVKYYRKPDLSWFYKKSNKFHILGKYALVVPGGSGKRLNKRIPIELFFEVVSLLIRKNIKPILIGAKDDFHACKKIEEKYPRVKNLCLQTSLFDIASLAINSLFSIGNDTGPTHIISRANKKTIVLFTKNSNPNLCGPVGKLTETLTFDNNDIFFNKILLEKTKKAISQ